MWLRATNQALRICDEVIVTSDIPEVKLTPMPEKVTFNPRPNYLSTDDTKMESVIYYIIKTYKLEKKSNTLAAYLTIAKRLRYKKCYSYI